MRYLLNGAVITITFKYTLQIFQASGGTISQLRSCLMEMCRNDCVTVIDRDTGRLPLPSNTQQPSNNAG